MNYSQRYTELQQQLEKEQDPRKRISLLLGVAEQIKNFEVDRALDIAGQVIELARQLHDVTARGHGLCLKGFCLRLKGDYTEGVIALKEALEIGKSIADITIEAVANYYLGSIYRDMGSLAEAYAHYARALEINMELGDEYYQAVIQAVISNLLYDFNDLDSALEYALKCLPIFERVNNINSLLNVCDTLGNTYFRKEQYNEALYYFEQNLKRSSPDTAAYILAECGVGKVYYKMHRPAEARKHLEDALERARRLDNVEVRIGCNLYLGCLLTDDGATGDALKHLEKAQSLAELHNRRQDLMVIYEKLSALYEKQGDYEHAFGYIRKYEQLKDEIFKQNVLTEMNNLQMRQQMELAQKEKEVAERAAEMKHKFLANMSHEIRTPMNAIVGMTRLILNKNPRPEHLRYLNAIRMSADNLLVIINDILDFSKIEAGKVTLEEIDFNLHETLEGLGDMLRTKSDEKQLEMRIVIEPGVPLMVKGDPTKMSQVLINLAGNAIKFTEKGFVSITAVPVSEDDETVTIRFDVTDTGIGIAEKYLATIFDSFTQAGSDITRKFGGTGLGLSISKQLTLLMGGDIHITSELGKGSTFAATMVFNHSEAVPEAKKNETEDKELMNQLKNLKILLVEDNEFNRMVAEDTLEEAIPGVDVHTAVDGSDAVERLKTDRFDVVLMDIQMPVMDGVTATRTIRTTLEGDAAKVKIVAMTANVMQEDVNEYLAAGMDAYVSKPFKTDELLRQLAAVTSGLSMKVNDTTPAKEPELKSWSPITDMTFIRQFTGGRDDKIVKYVGMFLDNAPKVLSQLQATWEAGDHAGIRMTAHSFKPQLSYMGVKEEVSHIKQIEQMADDCADLEVIGLLIAGLKDVCKQAFEELSTIK